MRATGWLGKWEWKIAKRTISINRKACQSTVHGCSLNCTPSLDEWKTSLCSEFTVSTLTAAENYTSILHLHWFTCRQQKAACSTVQRRLANRLWVKAAKGFLMHLLFSDKKEAEPHKRKTTPQVKKAKRKKGKVTKSGRAGTNRRPCKNSRWVLWGNVFLLNVRYCLEAQSAILNCTFVWYIK